jgi:uncharacterized protein
MNKQTQGDADGTNTSEERATPEQLEVGDFVRWQSSGGTAQGRITRIVRDGQLAVPDTEVTINGEAEDPAALIRIYRENEEGWKATDTLVGHRFSTLTKIPSLRSLPVIEAEARDLPENYRPALEEDVPEGRACGNCYFYDEERINPDGDQAYCEKWGEFVRGDHYCNSWSEDEPDREESRAVNLSPPAYMRAAARRGLAYHEQGLSGDGLADATVREARAMARGNVTADKWVRINAWIARHLVDLDAPAANPNNEKYPSAGVVAHLLWGSGPSKAAARRTKDFADSVVARLEEENRNLTTTKGESVSKVEVRNTHSKFELRAEADGMTFEGYAAVWDSPSEPLPFTERIRQGAFERSIKRARNDIKLLWNHDTGSILGSTRAGTLKLVEDNTGLKVIASLPETTVGRDAAVLLKRGDIDSMSFGFSVPAGGDSWNEDGSERTLKSVRLHEVSIVAFPAYAGTSGKTLVRGLDRFAERNSIDADALADAMLKLEEGNELTDTDANLLRGVIETLSPVAEQPEALEEETPAGDKEMLDLVKTKLKLMNGMI